MYTIITINASIGYTYIECTIGANRCQLSSYRKEQRPKERCTSTCEVTSAPINIVS